MTTLCVRVCVWGCVHDTNKILHLTCYINTISDTIEYSVSSYSYKYKYKQHINYIKPHYMMISHSLSTARTYIFQWLAVLHVLSTHTQSRPRCVSLVVWYWRHKINYGGGLRHAQLALILGRPWNYLCIVAVVTVKSIVEVSSLTTVYRSR